jgi:crotonobetainyl-CoA:carnitine CoA-transferase CaiB-like acyl-CoA transferase
VPRSRSWGPLSHCGAGAPTLGEHGRELLADAGLGPDEIERLISDGVVAAGRPV